MGIFPCEVISPRISLPIAFQHNVCCSPPFVSKGVYISLELFVQGTYINGTCWFPWEAVLGLVERQTPPETAPFVADSHSETLSLCTFGVNKSRWRMDKWTLWCIWLGC